VKIFWNFYEPELLKTNQNKFRIEKIIRKNKNFSGIVNSLDTVKSLTQGSLLKIWKNYIKQCMPTPEPFSILAWM